MNEDIKKILEYGVMAPSSHNSQPWKFFVSENKITILPDFSRSLKHGDKNNRQLFVSLGCALENMLQAALALGLEVEYTISTEGSTSIFFGDRKAETKPGILHSIENRVTNRNPYVETSELSNFEKYAQDLSDDTTNVFICKNKIKEKIADVAVEASVAAMQDKNFRRELSHYLKNNRTSSKIGMPAYGMGISTPVSFMVPLLINFVNVNKLSQEKDRELLKKHTPTIVIIATKIDTKKSWIKTGILYQKMALEAEKNKFSTAMWAAPIQTGTHYKEIQKILRTDLRPQAFFRLGKTDKETKHSPRLPAEQVTLKN